MVTAIILRIRVSGDVYAVRFYIRVRVRVVARPFGILLGSSSVVSGHIRTFLRMHFFEFSQFDSSVLVLLILTNNCAPDSFISPFLSQRVCCLPSPSLYYFTTWLRLWLRCRNKIKFWIQIRMTTMGFNNFVNNSWWTSVTPVIVCTLFRNFIFLLNYL